MTPDELRTRMVALPEPVTTLEPPYWEHWRWLLWKHVTEGNDPYGFMGWPEIYHCMLQRHWPHVVQAEATEIVRVEGAKYPASPAHPDKFYPRDEFLVPTHSENLIHQMYHLWKWQQVTGRKIADLDMITEFGGGYGAMSLVARRMGFRGSYFIQDLPEFELLQEFFLSNADPYSGTTFFSHGKGWIGDKPASLLVAGYSLSECPFTVRDEFLDANPADSYLLWYSNRFEEYDNLEYFQIHPPQWCNGLTWKHWKATHMPPETWYSVGWRT